MFNFDIAQCRSTVAWLQLITEDVKNKDQANVLEVTVPLPTKARSVDDALLL